MTLHSFSKWFLTLVPLFFLIVHQCLPQSPFFFNYPSSTAQIKQNKLRSSQPNLSGIPLDPSYYRNSTTQELNADRIKDLIRKMYLHGWNNYLKFGYPKDDLAPLTCSGKMSIGTNYVTLIDAADGLAILGEIDEFRKAIKLISQIKNFDIDVKVSVFETTIRLLGGLLSNHVLAEKHLPEYDGSLLPLAVDLADRLLVAFDTPTGVNYANVNLRRGILPLETTFTCTACAGLTMEFGFLSYLTGNMTYYQTTKASMQYIWGKRSPLNLLGTYIDIKNGNWIRKISGIGAELDSFFEYLWKSYILFQDDDFYTMFHASYEAIEKYLRCGERHIAADMNTGKVADSAFQALQSFWSGLQVSLGEFKKSLNTMKLMNQITWNLLFIPERLYLTPYSTTTQANYYILRPELIESIYFLNSAIDHPALLEFGFEMLQRLYNHTMVPCGFAGIRNVDTMQKNNHMESFFLAETLKYLYLMFDKTNDINTQPYIFTTEAHPFPIKAWTDQFQASNLKLNTTTSFFQSHLKKPSSYTCKAEEYTLIKEKVSQYLNFNHSKLTSWNEFGSLASCESFTPFKH